MSNIVNRPLKTDQARGSPAEPLRFTIVSAPNRLMRLYLGTSTGEIFSCSYSKMMELQADEVLVAPIDEKLVTALEPEARRDLKKIQWEFIFHIIYHPLDGLAAFCAYDAQRKGWYLSPFIHLFDKTYYKSS